MPNTTAVAADRQVRFVLMIFSMLALGFIVCATATAQIPGTFVATGNMTAARAGHTATLLMDGKALIVGGGPSTAEIYDPSDRTFTTVGSVNRLGHSATLLRDGKVLLGGGFDSSTYEQVSTADLYDPATNTFSSTGSLLEKQWGHTATLLRDGRVLIAAGKSDEMDSTGRVSDRTRRAELYDPATGTFSFAGQYAGSIGYADAPVMTTMLPDGKVLLAGENPAQVYDPSTDTFTFTGEIVGMGWRYAATTLMDGTVLITPREGDLWCSPPANAEIYHPSDGTFLVAGAMTKLVGSITLLRDGSVLFAGGGGSPCDVSDTAELYVPPTRSFVAIGRMRQSRTEHAATLLRDGSMLITGGRGSWGYAAGPALASAELYRPAEPRPRQRAVRH